MNSTPRVKICGLTRLEDAKLSASLGAWALGFIFFKKSPRFIEPKAARKIIDQIEKENLQVVGVAVNPSLDEVENMVLSSKINTLQLHGLETPEFCRQVKDLYPSIQLIKAISPSNPQELQCLADYAPVCEAFLIDASVEGLWGGTGMLSRWDLALKAKEFGAVILSGGLNEANIQAAMSQVSPFAVDVSSGIESKPGAKSHDKLKSLFCKVRSAK